MPLNFEGASFNDGFIIIDLAKWRSLNVTDEVRWWIQQHKMTDPALWKFGTQPITLLIGSGRWQQLPPGLYVGDLGFRQFHELDKGLLKQAAILHFDGEHKPWLPATVSDTNMKQHGMLASWNSHLLDPYAAANAPVEWLSAPGARCLFDAAPALVCHVGPLVPGTSTPGLHWYDSLEQLQNMSVEPMHTVEPIIAGHFSASPLAQLPQSTLMPWRFSDPDGHVQLLFTRPRRLLGVYLQAVSAQQPISGVQLQARDDTGSKGLWVDACQRQDLIACDPHRGPSYSASSARACWHLTDCRAVQAWQWRLVGWPVGQLFGGVWLEMATDEVSMA